MKTIYLTRHGESEFNVKKLIGGNSNLSKNGEKYSEKLFSFFKKKLDGMQIWTSQLNRTIQTAKKFKNTKIYPELNEINSGICDGMTYSQIEKKYPNEFKKRQLNKYHYRYPNGESYHDINIRLKKIYDLIDNTENNILIVAHQAVLRVLISHYIKRNINQIPYLKVSLNTIYKITLNDNNYELEIIEIK